MFYAIMLRLRARKINKLKEQLSADLTRYYDHLLYHSRKPGGIDVIDDWEIVKALR